MREEIERSWFVVMFRERALMKIGLIAAGLLAMVLVTMLAIARGNAPPEPEPTPSPTCLSWDYNTTGREDPCTLYSR